MLDGRDIGTVICPEADVKLFVTASDDVRAQRRLEEMLGKGIETSYDEVLADLVTTTLHGIDDALDIRPSTRGSPARDPRQAQHHCSISDAFSARLGSAAPAFIWISSRVTATVLFLSRGGMLCVQLQGFARTCSVRPRNRCHASVKRHGCMHC